MVWPLTPRSLATSATFLPDAIRSRTRRLNSGGYLLGMPTSSWGHGHDESNDATPPKWGNIIASTGAGQDQPLANLGGCRWPHFLAPILLERFGTGQLRLEVAEGWRARRSNPLTPDVPLREVPITLRGWCPGPLDDGTLIGASSLAAALSGGPAS